MNVNFTTATVTSLALGISVGGNSYNLAGGGYTISGFGSAVVFSGGSSSATGGSCGAGCAADVVGQFLGAGAARAGAAFKFDDGQSIAGAAAFKNNATR